MGLSFGHLLVVLIIIFVVFGAGRLPQVMGDIGRGMRSLRDGLKNDPDQPENQKQITHQAQSSVSTEREDKKDTV